MKQITVSIYLALKNEQTYALNVQCSHECHAIDRRPVSLVSTVETLAKCSGISYYPKDGTRSLPLCVPPTNFWWILFEFHPYQFRIVIFGP